MYWIIYSNDERIVSSDFNDAVNLFLLKIKKHIFHNNYAYGENNIPNCLDLIFNNPIEKRYLTDEEVLIYGRIKLLFNEFDNNFLLEKKNINLLEKSLSLKKEIKMFKSCIYDLDINLLKIDDSIEMNIDIKRNNSSESNLHTNAFVFINPAKEYYFISEQLVKKAEKSKDELIYFDIHLEMVE